MSKYTTTIKNLLDNNFDFQLNEYPIFDENYRQTLNQKILYHYYENEIGFETAGLFRFYLKNKMNEIMPYYNELYKVQKKLIDENLLLKNINITENLQGSDTKHDTNNSSVTTSNTSNSTNNGTTSSNSSSSNSSSSKNLFQDTPQGTISSTDINNQTWATNLTLDTNTSSDSSNNSSTLSNVINDSSSGSSTSSNTFNSNGTNAYLKTIVGNTGSKYNIDIFNDIKNKLMNIDLMIIDELNDLFMQIF